jgi:HlyD family secretion protein
MPMSPSMFVGRVVLPGLGLILAALLVWQSFGGAGPRLSGDPPEVAVGRSPGRDRIVAEGRVVAYPGAEVVVGTESGGTIVAMPVKEKDAVRKGDLLVEFRSDEIRAALDEAEARLAETVADLRHAERDVQRRERRNVLVPTPASEGEVDHWRTLETAIARKHAAQSARDRIRAQLARTRILAPIDGVVIARFAQAGETVEPSARLLTLANLSRLRIEAEVDEFDLARLTPGAEATITAEGFGPASWRGSVEEISDAVTARRIRPEDPGRPTDARILPVKIAWKEPTPLKLGQRVEVEIRSAQSGEIATPP